MGEGIGSGYRHVISHLPKRAKSLTCPLRSMQDWLGQRGADLGVYWGWTTEGGGMAVACLWRTEMPCDRRVQSQAGENKGEGE